MVLMAPWLCLLYLLEQIAGVLKKQTKKREKKSNQMDLHYRFAVMLKKKIFKEENGLSFQIKSGD